MKIAVIGAGSVGATLGKAWAERGHAVSFGVKDPGAAKIKSLLTALQGKADAKTVRDAAQAADVIVLATPSTANEEAVRAAGDLSGKVLIDVTNPLKPDLSGLTVGHDTSGAEELAKIAKGARVYKTLNQTGWENMAQPGFPEGKAVMFVAGDEPAGKATVLGLVKELGFEAIDAGNLSVSRWLEPLAMLWIHLMVKQKIGRHFAFSLLRR